MHQLKLLRTFVLLCIIILVYCKVDHCGWLKNHKPRGYLIRKIAARNSDTAPIASSPDIESEITSIERQIMFSTLIRRAAESSLPARLTNATRTPLTGVYNSRYKPKKIWPPDFSKLSQKEQFRFEKRYKRRVKLATARPRWDKYVRLVQLGTVTSELAST
jgi:hypothetical protein